MATIRLCDWTKNRLSSNDETFTLSLNGRDYEISMAALTEIQSRLDSDDVPPPNRVAVAKPPRIAQNADAPLASAPDVGTNVEAPNPFGGKAERGLLDDMPYVAPIAIPASTKERLPMPTTAQADAVVGESTRFPLGTLPTLTPGRHRNVAAKKLADKEVSIESKQKHEREKIQ